MPNKPLVMLSLGLNGITIRSLLCVDFAEIIPYCLAIALLYTAYSGQRTTQPIDAGNDAKVDRFIEALVLLKPCCDKWEIGIINPRIVFIRTDSDGHAAAEYGAELRRATKAEEQINTQAPEPKNRVVDSGGQEKKETITAESPRKTLVILAVICAALLVVDVMLLSSDRKTMAADTAAVTTETVTTEAPTGEIAAEEERANL